MENNSCVLILYFIYTYSKSNGKTFSESNGKYFFKFSVTLRIKIFIKILYKILTFFKKIVNVKTLPYF